MKISRTFIFGRNGRSYSESSKGSCGSHFIIDGNRFFDGIWFSILIVKAAELGAITPPVGMGIFVMKGVYPEARLEDITRGCLWFMLMDIITISLLIAFPFITTWLPSLMD